MGMRTHAMAPLKARVVCALALVLCANTASASTSSAPSLFSSAGKSILRQVNPRRSCGAFSDPGGDICRRDDWIYRAFGGKQYYVSSDEPKFELSWVLIVGSLIAILGSAAGSIGGVGGGVFYVPMLNVVMRFDPTTSVALSKAMVMGAAICAVGFNLKTKHPTEARALVNYQFAVLVQPTILLGISTGVILNTLLPDWLITFFLVVLFTKIIITSYRKATELSEQEKQDNSRNAAIDPGSQDESDNGDYSEIPSDSRSPQNNARNADDEKVAWQWLPRKPLAILFLTWLIFLALQIVKTMAPGCSFLYWLATLSQVPVAFGVAVWKALNSTFATQEYNTDGTEVSPPIKLAKGQDRVVRNLVLALLGFLAGIGGGLLGIGGGAILGPGFLELGLSPQESSTTASFIMVFSSSLSVVEYYFLGQLPKNFAIYFIILCMVASTFGQAVIKKIVVASGRSSIIVYILVGCTSFGNVTLGILGVMRSLEQWEAGENMGLQKFCP